jgi:hypothetical protein
LKDFLGIGSSGKAKPTPTPTPTPKPAQEDSLQSSQRRFRGTAQSPATGTLKPVVLNTARSAGATLPGVTPTTKPPPRQQVATRPRKVTERKQSEKTLAKALNDPRGASPHKDKSAANKNSEKRSAGTAPPKNAEKRSIAKAEIKAVVKQREKTGDPEPKASAPAPTPTPSPTPSPTATPTPAPIQSVPKGEGTFTLEICPISGLLPARGVCKNTLRQRFKLGGEPTKFCNAAHHSGK